MTLIETKTTREKELREVEGRVLILRGAIAQLDELIKLEKQKEEKSDEGLDDTPAISTSDAELLKSKANGRAVD